METGDDRRPVGPLGSKSDSTFCTSQVIYVSKYKSFPKDHGYTYIHTHIHTHTHTHTQTDRQTDRQADRQTHTHIHTYIHTYIHIYITPSKLKCGIPIWKNSEGYWYLMPKKFVFPKGFGLLEGEKEVFS